MAFATNPAVLAKSPRLTLFSPLCLCLYYSTYRRYRFPLPAFNLRLICPVFFFFLCSGNTMMIIVESMSNGALDSFLRVSRCIYNIKPAEWKPNKQANCNYSNCDWLICVGSDVLGDLKMDLINFYSPRQRAEIFFAANATSIAAS